MANYEIGKRRNSQLLELELGGSISVKREEADKIYDAFNTQKKFHSMQMRRWDYEVNIPNIGYCTISYFDENMNKVEIMKGSSF